MESTMVTTTVVFLVAVAAMVVAVSADGGYGNGGIPKPVKPVSGNGGYGNGLIPSPRKPARVEPKKLPKKIAIQGLIYCKSGTKLIPLKGATARITCLGVDKNGYESAPFSVSSCPSDAKGYFYTTIDESKCKQEDASWKLTECKAFLENSVSEECKIPSDVNKGISGALLTASRLTCLQNNVNLYSVGPFIYTSDTPTPRVSKPMY